MREGNTVVISWSTNCTDQNLEIAVNSRLNQEQLNGIVDLVLNDSTFVIIGNKDIHCVPDNYRFKIKVFSIHSIHLERELEEFENGFRPSPNLMRRANNSRIIVLYTDFTGGR